MELKERIQLTLAAVGVAAMLASIGFGMADMAWPFVGSLLGGVMLVFAAAAMD